MQVYGHQVLETKLEFIETKMEQLDFIYQLVLEFYETDDTSILSGELKTALIELINNPSLGKIWLIQNEDIFIGYIILTFGFSLEYKGRDAFIDEFYIKQEFRGRGLGKASLDFIFNYSIKIGLKALHLEVKSKHYMSEKLYKEKGFTSHKSKFMTKLINNSKYKLYKPS